MTNALDRARTCDLKVNSLALYQLSYKSKCCNGYYIIDFLPTLIVTRCSSLTHINSMICL